MPNIYRGYSLPGDERRVEYDGVPVRIPHFAGGDSLGWGDESAETIRLAQTLLWNLTLDEATARHLAEPLVVEVLRHLPVDTPWDIRGVDLWQWVHDMTLPELGGLAG